MSTRSNIAILNENGLYDVIYCHMDGYPQHNGAILFEYYDTEEKVRELIALGNISTLGQCIGEQHDFEEYLEDTDERKKWTKAYGRDRGETHQGGWKISSLKEVCEEEWAYVYSVELGWTFCKGKRGYTSLKTFIETLNNEEEE